MTIKNRAAKGMTKHRKDFCKTIVVQDTDLTK